MQDKIEKRGGARKGAGRKPRNGVGTFFTGLAIEKDTKNYFSSIKPENLTNTQFLTIVLNTYLTISKK